MLHDTGRNLPSVSGIITGLTKMSKHGQVISSNMRVQEEKGQNVGWSEINANYYNHQTTLPVNHHEETLMQPAYLTKTDSVKVLGKTIPTTA